MEAVVRDLLGAIGKAYRDVVYAMGDAGAREQGVEIRRARSER